jgi:LruC domain-containing protein
MMKLVKQIFTVALVSSLFVSCEKESTTDNVVASNSPSSSMELRVPANFNFATSKDLNFTFNLDQAPLNGKYLVEVYAAIPSAGQGSLYKSFLSSSANLNFTAEVPAEVNQVYILLWAPDGSSFLTVLPISGTSLNHTFYKGKNQSGKMETASPDCNSGCDVTRTHSGWWTADEDSESRNETTYCVTGSYNGSGGITITDKSIVRLCGSGSIPTVTINKGVLEITGDANVTINNLNLNSDKDNEIIVYPGGSLTITNTFSPNADITNYGTISLSALNLNSNAELKNYGTFNVVTNNSTSLNGDVKNYGSMTFSGNLTINGGSDFDNYCTLICEGDLNVNGDIDNDQGYIRVDDRLLINGGGKIILDDGAQLSTKDIWINGKIEGKGSTSIIKVSGRSDANWGSEIKKNLEYCDADGIENFPNNIFKNGAKAACDVTIQTSACNPEGNGVTSIADADNDGVADELDAYPNDASRAANSFFPGENVYGTLAYEDLWPAFGDYDFNDLVVDYRYQNVLNADNEVVDLVGRFVTRSLGGDYENGFGIQLDLPSAAVSAVSGAVITENIVNISANGTEQGQTNATIIVYDNAKSILPNTTGASFVNTVSANPKIDNDTLDLNISFNTPQIIASLGQAPFNPFIFINGTRGREVHLAGYAPTDLADVALFGTIDDNTNPNSENTYKSSNNLPWAINIVGGFSYPEERVDIASAYSFFGSWAQSGGSANQNWYIDLPGNINASDLYQ